MIDLQEVTLDIATASSAPILANLLELYVHDLSGVFAIDIGADGRFGYDRSTGLSPTPILPSSSG
jgi:hypothetical protein